MAKFVRWIDAIVLKHCLTLPLWWVFQVYSFWAGSKEVSYPPHPAPWILATCGVWRDEEVIFTVIELLSKSCNHSQGHKSWSVHLTVLFLTLWNVGKTQSIGKIKTMLSITLLTPSWYFRHPAQIGIFFLLTGSLVILYISLSTR